MKIAVLIGIVTISTMAGASQRPIRTTLDSITQFPGYQNMVPQGKIGVCLGLSYDAFRQSAKWKDLAELESGKEYIVTLGMGYAMGITDYKVKAENISISAAARKLYIEFKCDEIHKTLKGQLK